MAASSLRYQSFLKICVSRERDFMGPITNIVRKRNSEKQAECSVSASQKLENDYVIMFIGS